MGTASIFNLQRFLSLTLPPVIQLHIHHPWAAWREPHQSLHRILPRLKLDWALPANRWIRAMRNLCGFFRGEEGGVKEKEVKLLVSFNKIAWVKSERSIQWLPLFLPRTVPLSTLPSPPPAPFAYTCLPFPSLQKPGPEPEGRSH